jgi:hypothetical protein
LGVSVWVARGGELWFLVAAVLQYFPFASCIVLRIA